MEVSLDEFCAPTRPKVLLFLAKTSTPPPCPELVEFIPTAGKELGEEKIATVSMKLLSFDST